MFDTNKLRPLFGDVNDSARGFLYTSEFETPEMIDEPNYWGNAGGHNIREGDFIFLLQGVEGKPGAKYSCHRVTSVTPGGAGSTTFLCGVYSHSGQQLWDALRIVAALLPVGD